METRWGVQFKDEDMKISILGLTFLRDGRTIPEELPEDGTNALIDDTVNVDRHAFRTGYWTYALPILVDAHGGNGPYSGVAPADRTYCDGFFGVGSLHLFCAIKQRPQCATVGLWIDTSKYSTRFTATRKKSRLGCLCPSFGIEKKKHVLVASK